MATFHDRTLASKFQGRLLRAAGPCAVLTSAEAVALVADLPISFTFRPSLPVDDPRTADELMAEIAAEIRRQEVCSAAGQTSELPPEPLLSEGEGAAVARTIHLRRQLEEAAEHGAALLAALGLPRLVTPDFEAISPQAAGDALDAAIAALDALDGDPDLEDGDDDEASLGWNKPASQLFLTDGSMLGHDLEHDTADAEPSLASPERHPEVPEHPCSWVYTDTGPNSSQLRWAEGAQHGREDVNEDGDELDAGEHDDCDKEPSIGWPEDFRAELSDALQADHDPELDDADLEGDEPGADVWVFGPSRQERPHV